MINLENKNKQEKYQPPPPLGKPTPAPYSHPFFNFSDSLLSDSQRDIIKFHFLPLLKKGGSEQ